jgi:hypothetical protein
LEQVPVSLMAPVKRYRITCQQPLHNPRNWGITRSEQQVKVIGYQCPGKTSRLGIFDNGTQTCQEVFPVHVVQENLPTLDSPDDDVMQGAGRIYSSFSCHMLSIQKVKVPVNLFYYVRPQKFQAALMCPIIGCLEWI